jgi:preprotein translocase subunit SecA
VSSLLTRPGAALGIYPEREHKQPGPMEQVAGRISSAMRAAVQPWDEEIYAAVTAIEEHCSLFEKASARDLEDAADDMRQQFASTGQTNEAVSRAFALVRQVATRELGQRHSDQHLACGWALFRGMLAEIEAGEDKSLVALLPACTAALSGVPVHIITANDYLAERDAYRMRPIFTALGISSGRVSADMPLAHRCKAYRCDITYGSARQFATDYLEDRLLLQGNSGKLQQQVGRLNKQGSRLDQLRLQGLCFAIVDHAATTMIEDALSPLLLTQASTEQRRENGPQVLARISYPRFFQRYMKLCGMSGSLREVAAELRELYGMDLFRTPLQQPCQRQIAAARVFPDADSKWQAIVEAVRERHLRRQPVLIGLRSAEAAEELGDLLGKAKIGHQILDAGKPSEAASKLAGAGAPGSVTLAMHRDGLGTEISLGEAALSLGGLHIILSEHLDGAYLDLQFSQRCARRGEPGSVAPMLSLDDELAVKFLPESVRALFRRSKLPGDATLLSLAQLRQEATLSRARRQLLHSDRQTDELLAFSGRGQ